MSWAADWASLSATADLNFLGLLNKDGLGAVGLRLSLAAKEFRKRQGQSLPLFPPELGSF